MNLSKSDLAFDDDFVAGSVQPQVVSERLDPEEHLDVVQDITADTDSLGTKDMLFSCEHLEEEDSSIEDDTIHSLKRKKVKKCLFYICRLSGIHEIKIVN